MKIAPLAAAVIFGLTGTAALAQAVNTDWYIAPTVSYTINDDSRATNHGWAQDWCLAKFWTTGGMWKPASNTSNSTVKMMNRAVLPSMPCTFLTATLISRLTPHLAWASYGKAQQMATTTTCWQKQA